LPRISDLISYTAPSNSDLLAIVDQAGAVTKKITRADLLKGTALPADTVTTPAITDASVTPDKLSLSPATTSNSATGTTGSSSYTTTLSGGGTTPSATVTIGANGLALVSISADAYVDGASKTARMSFAVSGASTVASSDATCIASSAITAATRIGVTTLVTGLTAGSNTFTLEYKATPGTASFRYRSITVVPL
jgi:hypothetical protein